MPDQPNDRDEILWGAASIGPVIGINQRKAFHLLQAGQLPAKKVGKTWVTTRARLLKHVLGDAAADWVPPPPKPKPVPTHVPRSRKLKLRARKAAR